eukprot:894113-Pelagomonas_calceolata.AAC.9
MSLEQARQDSARAGDDVKFSHSVQCLKLLYNNAWDRAKQCLRHANESYLNQVQGTEIPCRRFDCFAICTNKTQKKEKEKTLSTAQSQMYVHIIQRAAGNA